MPEILDIINMDDQVIGQATREDVYEQKHMHRIVHVIVRDITGRFILQIRSDTVKYLPGYWSTSAGGHVQTGETYLQAAHRELEEEMGVKVSNLKELGKFFYEGNGLQKYLKVYECILEQSITIGEEVHGIEIFTYDETHKLITTHDKIHPELKFLWEKLYT